jgi:hypothetical protein
MSAIDFYVTTNRDQAKYSQLPRRLISAGAGNLPYSSVDSSANPAVGFFIESQPAIGSMIPVWLDNEVLNPQPALIQLDGTFAYKYTHQSGNTYPLTAEVSYTFREACHFAKFYGKIYITIWDADSLAASRAQYHCTVTKACIPEAVSGENRPVWAQQVLPRIWSSVAEYTTDNPPRPCFAAPEESATFKFDDNSLWIEGYGRAGWGTQRVFGFNALKPDQYLWNKTLIDKTASFDQQCVENVAKYNYDQWVANGKHETLGVWGKTFAGPAGESRWSDADYGSNFCQLVNTPNHLCNNAPLLTVRSGFLKKIGGAVSTYKEPWLMKFEECRVHVTGVFPWDLMRRLTRTMEVSDSYLVPDPIEAAKQSPNLQKLPVFEFTYPQAGNPSGNIPQSNIVIKFSFYNMAIQPFSFIDMSRSFVDINDRYDVTLNVRQCLKFEFESGQDTFTVDFQWFRYKSVAKISPDTDANFPWGLGLNLIIYPEAYDAAYSQASPRIQNVLGVPKKYHNNVPRKIRTVGIYNTRDPGTGNLIPNGLPDDIGRPHDSTGRVLWFDDQSGWDGVDNAYEVYPCAAEPQTGNNPSSSCDWQNVTLRFARKNPDETPSVSALWTEEVVLEFLLNDGQRPTLRLKPGLLQTAVDASGAFSGCTGLCRTVPYLLESLRGNTISNDPGAQWNANQICDQNSKANYHGAGSWTQACGWDARSGQNTGCAVEQTHDSVTIPTKCVPAVSITCEEPDAVTYGPDDRVIFVYDIYNMDSKYVEPVSIRFEWSSKQSYWMDPTQAEKKVWVFHEGGAAAVALLNNGVWFSPSYNWLNTTIMTERERNNKPLSNEANSFRKWDFGFAFNPGLLNENMKIRVYTTLRVLVTARDTSIPYRQPSNAKTARRFQPENVDKLDCFVPQRINTNGQPEAPVRRRMRQMASENERAQLDYTEEISFDPNFGALGRRQTAASTSNDGSVRTQIARGDETVQNGETLSAGDVPSPWALSGIILGVTIALVGMGIVAVLSIIRKRNFFPTASGQSFSDVITK